MNKIHYELMIDTAMRSVVAEVLQAVAVNGMPDNHSFYISFDTHAQGVQLSDKLKKRYPEEITIVLQYQFENLTVEKERFRVSLHFDGEAEVVIVPFIALTAFADPHAKFALEFTMSPTLHVEPHRESVPHSKHGVTTTSDNNVIALDHFRNKKPR